MHAFNARKGRHQDDELGKNYAFNARKGRTGDIFRMALFGCSGGTSIFHFSYGTFKLSQVKKKSKEFEP